MPVELTVTDVKQWRYCQRIVFYQKIIPVHPPRTYKMARAHGRQDRLERLEARRKLADYGLPAGERRFDVRLVSERWNLSGAIDLLIETPDALFPVDFKDTEGPPRENHRWQLAGYAILLAEKERKPVPAGFIHRVPDGEVFRFDLDPSFLEEVQRSLGEMVRMVEEERFPEPTELRSRCEECEYRNFCGDVF